MMKKAKGGGKEMEEYVTLHKNEGEVWCESCSDREGVEKSAVTTRSHNCSLIQSNYRPLN